jgi:aryl sulfotransferase
MADPSYPCRVRTYQNQLLDSTRWDRFRPRGDDVLISTSHKSGTTWMQRIVSLLVFGAGPLPSPLISLSPWVDARLPPLDRVIERLERQEHRRFVKSHLPLDALPYYPQVRYIWVARDTRDVFMSLWNHYHSMTEATYEALSASDPEGGPFPRCPDDPRDFWQSWITRASFPWESDGWPWWSHHYHAASFWQYRHLPNLLAVHYNDLLADLAGQMRRVARFLGIHVAEADWPALVAAAHFDAMREAAIHEEAAGDQSNRDLKGGAASFFFKGTNGRWCDILSHEDLALYEQAAARLDPGLRSWLEEGSHHPLHGCPAGNPPLAG